MVKKKAEEKGSKPLDRPKMELFVQLYSGQHNMELFGNGTRCYIVAYGYQDKINKNIEQIEELNEKAAAGYTVKVKTLEAVNKRIKNMCSVEATRILVNPRVRDRCDYLLRSTISNSYADQELQYVILQRRDLNAKVQAIREHNRVAQRVKEGFFEGNLTVSWGDPE